MAVKKFHQGFTLIEMVVVVAIFAVVATVLFVHFSDFTTGVSVRDLSQEIALATRKAQTYATSVRSLDGVTVSADTYKAYGVSFSASDPTGGSYTPSNTKFIIFADSADGGGTINRYYDNNGSCGSPSASGECLESFDITGGNKIVQICTDYPTPNTCATSGTVNIVFRRPSPDAEICVVQGASCSSLLASYARITIQSPKGDQKTVTIWSSGQISGQ